METGGNRIWSLAYADVVLLAKSKEALKQYLKKKKLVLSCEKSKVMVFEESRGRKKKRK